MSKKIFLYILLINLTVMFISCGETEKKKFDSEKRLIQLAEETLKIVEMVEESEKRYSEREDLTEWKLAFQIKKSEINDLLNQLNYKIREGRFFEKLPEEHTRTKAKLFLHAAENIKMYINIINTDLTQMRTNNPPPAFDIYSRERYLKPAVNELENLISGK